MSGFSRRLQFAVASNTPVIPSSQVTKVLIVMEENHSLAEMQASMPYLNGLATQYGYANNYFAITHPSCPNYIAITGGSTFGITDDGDPSTNSSKLGNAQSVFDQALAAGKTAKTYAESMMSNCELTNDGNYAVRHNPWTYYSAGQTNAQLYNVPMATNFTNDVAANNLPNVGMLVPNVINDAHDASLSVADTWLSNTLPSVLSSSDFTSGKLVVIVVADEDDSTQGNKVLTVVMHPSLHGAVISTTLNHYSLTRYCAELVGVAPLLNGATAASLKTAFGL
jgi:hypothetical protein